MSAQASRTLGTFNVPDALPALEFDSVNERVARRGSGNDYIWYGFASAWSGVAYRMRAALDHEQVFSASVAHSTAPPPDERYRQDHDLFGFVVSSLSAIECVYFAAYCIGSLLKPTDFPLSKPSSLKFYPPDVSKRFQLAFPGDMLTDAMRAVLGDPEYEQLRDLRNVLAHRGTPPRMHFFSSSGPGIPSAIPSNLADLASTWRYDLQLNPQCLVPYRTWLEGSLDRLIKAAFGFTSTHL
jgi:hypothetical protein